MPYETKNVSNCLRAGKCRCACCHAGGGAIGLRGNGGGGRPTAQRRYIPPVVIEIADGTISLSFMRNLGEVTIELQQTLDITVFSQTINASTQHETDSWYVYPDGYHCRRIHVGKRVYCYSVKQSDQLVISG